jgi:hypothetical protein
VRLVDLHTQALSMELARLEGSDFMMASVSNAGFFV